MTPTLTKLLEDLRSGAVRLVPGEALEKAFRSVLMEWERRREHLNCSPSDKDKFVTRSVAELSAASPDLTPALVEMIEGLVRERDEAVCNLDALMSDVHDTREMIVEANAKRRAAEAERDALREALAAARTVMRNAWGAVTSDQVVDKQVDKMLRRGLDAVDRALTMETNDG